MKNNRPTSSASSSETAPLSQDKACPVRVGKRTFSFYYFNSARGFNYIRHPKNASCHLQEPTVSPSQLVVHHRQPDNRPGAYTYARLKPSLSGRARALASDQEFSSVELTHSYAGCAPTVSSVHPNQELVSEVYPGLVPRL